MRAYKQLTEEDRIEIYAMKQAGKQQHQMAAALGVSPSTISRELARNTGRVGHIGGSHWSHWGQPLT